MQLFLMRHGRTDWNEARRLQGSSDIELNSDGIDKARITSRALQDLHFDAIYSSPLKRAFRTAQILAQGHNVRVVTDQRISELNFGVYEGHVIETLPAEFMDFFNDTQAYKVPENGESLEHLVARGRDFIEKVVVPSSLNCDRIAVVAHGAMNQALRQTLDHKSIADFWGPGVPKNCSITIYDIQGRDFRLLEENKIYY